MKNATKPNYISNLNIKPLIIGFVLGGLCASLFFFNSIQSTDNCNLSDFDKSKIITISKAQELYDTYTSRRVEIIEAFENTTNDDVVNYKASRYGSYSFTRLKNYIAYLECINEKIKITSSEKDSIESIRFYFAAYPNSDTFTNDGSAMVTTNFNGADFSLKRRSTFMMLPTTKFGGQEKGFMYKMDGDNIQLSEIGLDEATSYTSLIMNEVGLVPPPSSSVENDFN